MVVKVCVPHVENGTHGEKLDALIASHRINGCGISHLYMHMLNSEVPHFDFHAPLTTSGQTLLHSAAFAKNVTAVR